jgi:hypothetical protein
MVINRGERSCRRERALRGGNTRRHPLLRQRLLRVPPAFAMTLCSRRL